MENSQFKLEGAKEVMDALKELPIELQAKILKAFIRKAGKKFIVDEIKPLVHYAGEKGVNSIKVVGNPSNPLMIAAGVTASGYKLRWTDLGTTERKTKKGWNRGSISGRHQIQPTIEKQIKPIVDYTEKEMGNEINKMLQRRLKKLKKSI